VGGNDIVHLGIRDGSVCRLRVFLETNNMTSGLFGHVVVGLRKLTAWEFQHRSDGLGVPNLPLRHL
jgi:hypothetical protein